MSDQQTTETTHGEQLQQLIAEMAAEYDQSGDRMALEAFIAHVASDITRAARDTIKTNRWQTDPRIRGWLVAWSDRSADRVALLVGQVMRKILEKEFEEF